MLTPMETVPTASLRLLFTVTDLGQWPSCSENGTAIWLYPLDVWDLHLTLYCDISVTRQPVILGLNFRELVVLME